MRRLSGPAPTPRRGEILGFACVRDERLRLPWFLDHHFRCGVDRFFVVDNGSTDGTADYLLSRPEVTVFHTSASYAASRYGLDWLHELQTQFAPGHWSLTVDADEIFIYPGCEEMDLRGLTDYLDSEGCDALQTLLVDMYSDGPIRAASYEPEQSFLEVCPFFDASTYGSEAGHEVPVRGGPRQRAFWDGRDWDYPSPFLGKIPLVRWRAGLRYEASTHVIPGVRPSGLTGVLLHFKFFADFPGRVATEVERKEHFEAAKQYVAYDRALRENPELSLHAAAATRYESSRQLVELGLARMPASYRALLESLRSS